MGANPSYCKGEDYGQFKKPVKKLVKLTRRKPIASDSFRQQTRTFKPDHYQVAPFPVNSFRRNVPRVCQTERNAGIPFDTEYFPVRGTIQHDNISDRRKVTDEETHNPFTDMSPFDDVLRVDTKSFSAGKIIRQDDMSKMRQASVAETKNSVIDVCPFGKIILQDDMSELKEKKNPVIDTSPFNKIILQDNMPEEKDMKIPVVDVCSLGKIILQDNMPEVKETKNNVIDICPFDKILQQDNKSEVRETLVVETKNPEVDACKIILQDNMPEVKQTTNNVLDICPFDKIIQQDKSEVRETSVKEMKNSVVDACPFADVLYRFHTHKVLTDIILRANSVLFHVHKLVLCCRSVVFSDMFTEDLNAETSQYVDIAENADTIRRLLLYIYTSEVQAMQWKDAADLFKAANKYELLDLRDKCSVILKSKISRDNFCGVLSFADMYHETELLDAVLGFMSPIPDIFNSEAWKLFKRENPELAFNTMERIINNFRTSI